MTVPGEIVALMRETNERFCNHVIGQRDFAQANAVYTHGAYVLPPGAPMVEGSEAIADFWRVAVEGLCITGATLRTLRAEMAGDTVVEIGEAELALRAGGPLLAKYIV